MVERMAGALAEAETSASAETSATEGEVDEAGAAEEDMLMNKVGSTLVHWGAALRKCVKSDGSK